MSIQFIVTSILFGILPEAIYFTLFLIFAKNLKTKRIILFGLILLSYLVLSVFLAFSIWFHVAFMAAMYGIMWLLYRSELIDIFLISISAIILTLITVFCCKYIPDYRLGVLINRGLLFSVIFLFKNELNNLYLLYRSIWNVNKAAKIKSITVRNISLILLNLLLYTLSLIMVSVYSNF